MRLRPSALDLIGAAEPPQQLPMSKSFSASWPPSVGVSTLLRSASVCEHALGALQRRRVHLFRLRSHSKYNNTISGCLVDVDNASYLGRTDPKKFGEITASLLENGLFAAWETSFLSLAVSLRVIETPAHQPTRPSDVPLSIFVEGYSSRKFGC